MFRIFLFSFVVLCFVQATGQTSSHQYGLSVIRSLDSLESTIKRDPGRRFVRLIDYIPDLKLDIKYASERNVFYEKLYDSSYALIRLPVAVALAQVQAHLKTMGLGLKIYDAYRPYSVTCRMFDILPDTIYMGLPWTGSKHNRGIALDLTLISLDTQKELKMPTPFDALVYASHPRFTGLPDSVRRNRDLLITTMEKFGFSVDPVEWWHFNFNSLKTYEILDIPLGVLDAYVTQKRN